jgi:hypothetical protein
MCLVKQSLDAQNCIFEQGENQMKFRRYLRSAGVMVIFLLLLLASNNTVVYAGPPPVQPVVFRFTDTPPPTSDATLTVTAARDINHPGDLLMVFGEGSNVAEDSQAFSGRLFNADGVTKQVLDENGDPLFRPINPKTGFPDCPFFPPPPRHQPEGANRCVGWETDVKVTDSMTIPQANIAAFAANGFIRLVLKSSDGVGRLRYSKVTLTYDTASGKYEQTIDRGGVIGVLLERSSVRRSFKARELSGDQEVPPVDTPASGKAKFGFNDLLFKLQVDNIEDITAIHIHCAPKGQNGSVGVTLFSGGPVTQRTFQGTVKNPDPANKCDWSNLEDVRIEMQQGNTYINAHTPGHPAGEIRDQITK